MSLTRDEILAMDDISHKKLVVPENIPVWAGKEVWIRQLSRGDQDMYLKRQFGSGKMRGASAEINMEGLYGNDSWICSRGICDENGVIMFTPADIDKLNQKSGEFIGWLAEQILDFSGMLKDVKTAQELSQAVKDELKN